MVCNQKHETGRRSVAIKEIEIVGAGGIGSHLCAQIVRKVARNQFPDLTTLKIWEPDIIELKNRNYTIYECDPSQIGKPKADVLLEELQLILLMSDQHIDIQLVKEKTVPALSKLKKDTVFISAVDGSSFREKLFAQTTDSEIKRFVKENIWWIDLRSKGPRYIIMRNPTDKSGLELLEPYYGPAKKEGDSCQLAGDLQKNFIQIGNEMAALHAIKFLLNIQRDQPNELRFDYTATGDFNY